VRVFHELTRKPWLTSEGAVVDLPTSGGFALPSAKIGLRVLLLALSFLFLLLIIAYGGRMTYEDWRPAPQLGLLWLNTALLISSSLGLQWAVVGARDGQMAAVRHGLLLSGVFAFAFLAGQLVAWRQLQTRSVFDLTNPAIAFFYMITALHGLHLLGGLVAWARTAAKMWRGWPLAELRLSVELCAFYWHFLLIVWLVLFGLLFSGSGNLGILLAVCGLR
jgi:cytochrome c oxidase subunit 3